MLFGEVKIEKVDPKVRQEITSRSGVAKIVMISSSQVKSTAILPWGQT
jgi:hypothetical protein